VQIEYSCWADQCLNAKEEAQGKIALNVATSAMNSGMHPITTRNLNLPLYWSREVETLGRTRYQHQKQHALRD